MHAKAHQLAAERLEQRRKAAREAQTARREEAVRRVPAIIELERRISDCNAAMAQKCMVSPSQAKEIVEQTRFAVAALRRELREKLEGAGLSPDCLEVAPTCTICGDSGFLYEPAPQPCDCFTQLKNNALVELSGLNMDGAASFSTFNLSVFPDEPAECGPSQRAAMATMHKVCMRYADAYPNVEKAGLLFCGPSGLGKTFLLQSIAREVLSRGIPVLAVTAYRMMESMRRHHFGNDGDGEIDLMMDVDLLCIDDLGVEPLMENITIVQLLALLTERRARNKGTIIATNLMPRELMLRYTERVYSRLIDASHFRVLQFFGKDIRLSGR